MPVKWIPPNDRYRGAGEPRPGRARPGVPAVRCLSLSANSSHLNTSGYSLGEEGRSEPGDRSAAAGRLTPGGGLASSKLGGKAGGCDQSRPWLKETVPPEKFAPSKETAPPENSVPVNDNVPSENQARSIQAASPAAETRHEDGSPGQFLAPDWRAGKRRTSNTLAAAAPGGSARAAHWRARPGREQGIDRPCAGRWLFGPAGAVITSRRVFDGTRGWECVRAGLAPRAACCTGQGAWLGKSPPGPNFRRGIPAGP
jgi:hypothetical protein